MDVLLKCHDAVSFENGALQANLLVQAPEIHLTGVGVPPVTAGTTL
jgi:hypothetical protein